MKYLFSVSFLVLLSSSYILKPSSQKPLTIHWVVGGMQNDSLSDMPEKILKAMYENKIQAYDDSGNIVTMSYIKGKIEPYMLARFTKKDIEIMIANGDYSVMSEIHTNYTAEQLNKMLLKGKSIDKLFTLRQRAYYECNRLTLGLQETIYLDTTLTKQKGLMEYVELIIPAQYNASKKRELLCKLKYEDVKKLNLKTETNIIDKHTFIICPWDSDITIVDPAGTIERLSDLNPPGKRMPEQSSIDQSIFRYFKGSIYLFQTTTK